MDKSGVRYKRNALSFGWHVGYYAFVLATAAKETNGGLSAETKTVISIIQPRLAELSRSFKMGIDFKAPHSSQEVRRLWADINQLQQAGSGILIVEKLRIQYGTAVGRFYELGNKIITYALTRERAEPELTILSANLRKEIEQLSSSLRLKKLAIDKIVSDNRVMLSATALEEEVFSSLEQSPARTRDETIEGSINMRILFLAANPVNTAPLDLEEELRSLEQELRGVQFRSQIKLIAHHAVRPDDLIRHVRAHQPNVIHFSGHGSTTGIILRNDTGGYSEIEGASLQRFLEGRGIDLVVLNACYSRSQADMIRSSVKTVVGTTDVVDDVAARRFTVAFYRSLGAGLSVREAFRDGRDAVDLHGGIDVFHSDGELDMKLVGGDPMPTH
jgi:hypothetical protein